MRILNVIAAAGAFLLSVGSASASTITLDSRLNPSALTGATVECSIFCQGWDGSAWGNTAFAYGPPPTESRIADLFNDTNAPTGLGLDGDDFTKLEKGSDYAENVTAFVIDADYFHVFDANSLFLFRTFDPDGSPSSNPGSQVFTFSKSGGDGPSNVSSNGTISPVPLPAAGWLLLAGLGGLAAYGRKKRWA